MTKNFYVKNFKRWQSTLNAKTFSEEELEVKIIDNGIALPLRPLPKSQWEGGLCDENFNFIAGFSRIKPDGGKYAGGGVHVKLPTPSNAINLFSLMRT